MVKIKRHHMISEGGKENLSGQTNEATSAASQKIVAKVQELSDMIDKIGVHEYMVLCRNPKRMIIVNLVAGLFRGVGVAIGFTLLTAMVLYILNRLAILNIPFFGDIIVELMRYVENTKGIRL